MKDSRESAMSEKIATEELYIADGGKTRPMSEKSVLAALRQEDGDRKAYADLDTLFFWYRVRRRTCGQATVEGSIVGA